MKIGIDTFCCNHGNSGPGSYLISLVKNLQTTQDVSFELFGSEIDKYQFNSNSPDIPFFGLNIKRALPVKIWHRFFLPKFCRKRGYDAVLFPAFIEQQPNSGRVPSFAVVMGLHDQINLFQKKSFMHATRIFAATNYIRQQLIEEGIYPQKISVIHTGIDDSLFYPRTDFSGQDIVNIQPFAIKRPYLIYATAINSPKKKHIELIKAFTIFKRKTGLPHRLVLAGTVDDNYTEVQEYVAKNEFASDIFITGRFPLESMADLYSYAEACLFPSLADGVGLPIIEAMACSVPVACSKASALIEMAGDNAVFFNPDNVEEIASVIEKISTDKVLREYLTKKGLDHVKSFLWSEIAKKTVHEIEKSLF